MESLTMLKCSALRLAKTLVHRRFLCPTTVNLDLKREAVGSPVVHGPPGRIKTEADLPEITLPMILYKMLFKGYYNRLHEMQLSDKQNYGSMFKVSAGSIKTVVLCSAELVEELMRNDEKFPSRGDMTAWTEYRDIKGLGYGPFTEEGEKWYKLRAVLNKRMLHPKDSMNYENVINEVVTDFIKRINHLRTSSATGDLVPNLSNELYNFSLEGISVILFETRIGCLENKVPVETQDFIKSIGQMFTHGMYVNLFPKWTRNYLPFWQRYKGGWDGIFKFACKLIDKKMDDIQKRLDMKQEVEGEYLSYLLSKSNLNKNDVYGSVAELLLAGVDTTSNTMVWSLYLLSRHPEAQDKLYQEVAKVMQGDRIPTVKDINNMPYLKAVVKETLRMYPVVPINARLLENDVIIGGYSFPEKTRFTFFHYAVGNDETIFPDPLHFKPERWLRDGRETPRPFSSIPFGYGIRGCVGRRIAELEMHLLLTRIINLYEVKLDPSIGEVKAVYRSVLVADRPIHFHFLNREVSS